MMMTYYLKTAWRNLKVNKYYSLLNIVGLTIGLATAILLLLWVKTEKSYDRFNTKAGSIYRINNAYKTSDGQNVVWTSSPAPLKNIALKNSRVKNVVRIFPDYGIAGTATFGNRKLFDLSNVTKFVDDDFFNMFSFKLLKGNADQPFPLANSVIVSAEMARKLFAGADPMGQVIYLTDDHPFKISGVMQDMPENTSVVHADILLPMRYWAAQYAKGHRKNEWNTIDDNYGDFSYDVFAEITGTENLATLSKNITDEYSRLGGPDVAGNIFILQPLSTMHLIDENGSSSNLRMVQIFSWVSLLILLIASVNYVNLTTARSLIRAKEVSVRKIMGAGKKQLLIQFFTETSLVFFVSLLLALLAMGLLMPLYKTVTGTHPGLEEAGRQIMGIIGWVALGTFAATAIYPALLLSDFKPIQYLKGNVKTGIQVSYGRKLLVIIQFSISVMIILSAIVMMKQMHYIKTKDLGFNKTGVFMVNMPSEMSRHTEQVLQILKADPAVTTATTASADVADIQSSSGAFGIPGRDDINLIFHDIDVSPGFVPAMDMTIIAGQNFTGTAADSAHFILNQTAVNLLNLKQPIGAEVKYWGKQGRIWGVVRDFNFQNLKEKIGPIILMSRPGEAHGSVLYVRTSADRISAAVKATEQLYKKYGAERPFAYNFMDRKFAAQYASLSHKQSLLNAFALIAIFISCLGLFGLATFTAEAKTKEIGIRKILGASVTDIVGFISKEFIALVIIAIVLSIPVAGWMMTKWLQGFAYKTTIGALTFAGAAMLILLIAFLTIAIKAWAAASANPIKSLKVE